MLLPELRAEVCALHAELPKNHLVAWTSGNISARDPETNLIVIKPSGVRFEHLTPESMIVADMDGNVVEGHFKPSSDTVACRTCTASSTRTAATRRRLPCWGGKFPV